MFWLLYIYLWKQLMVVWFYQLISVKPKFVNSYNYLSSNDCFIIHVFNTQ